MARRLAVSLCAALAAACTSFPTTPDWELRSRVENGLLRAVVFDGDNETYTLPDRMAHYRVPGLSFALIDDGDIAWAAGYGVTRAGSPEPVEPTTLFQAASIAKPLTATAAMRMRDAGLIDFDTDIQAYLEDYTVPPGAQTSANPVTFRRLLSHTGGTTPGGYAGYEPGAPYPTDLQIVSGQAPANSPEVRVVSPPGTEVQYSGGGYTIVELAMQDVTGRSFEQLMDVWLLSVVGMPRSTFAQPLPPAVAVEAAVGHGAQGSVLPGGWRVYPEQAAAGLWSTPSELAAFAIAVRDAYHGRGDLLPQASAAELLTPVIGRDATGFVVRGEGDALTFSHAGGNPGYRAYMILHLASGDGAVFMANSDQGMALGREMLRAAAAVYGWPDFKPVLKTRAALERNELASLAGTYDFGDGLRVDVTLHDSPERLAITFPNGDVYSLVPVGPLQFIHADTGVTVDFSVAGGRNEVTVYGDIGVRIAD